MEQLSGGEALIRALQDEGVEFLFGYPGGAVLHIYDALFRQDHVEHILVRHEQAATHAAVDAEQIYLALVAFGGRDWIRLASTRQAFAD